jgi:hypothetical protein
MYINDYEKLSKTFFNLVNSPLIKWDERECFYRSSTAELLQKLTELDPTLFVAGSYLTELLNVSSNYVSFNVNSLLNNSDIKQWIDSFSALKNEADSLYLEQLNTFLNTINSRYFSSDDKNTISRNDCVLLLRDALFATELNVNWIYNYADKQDTVKAKPSSAIYHFNSFFQLERALLNKEIPYGIHVGFIASNKSHNKVANIIIYYTPIKAFVLNKAYFDLETNSMVSDQQSTADISYNKYSVPNQHFPNWKVLSKGMTETLDSSFKFATLDILSNKQKLWFIMSLELTGILADDITLDEYSSSAELIEHSQRSIQSMRLIEWAPKFEIEHDTFEDIVENLIPKNSLNAKWYRELIKDVSIDILLPDPKNNEQRFVGLDLINMLHTDEYTSKYSTEPSSVKKYISDNFEEVGVNLLPKPTNAFGNKEDIKKAYNATLHANLRCIIDTLAKVAWRKEEKAVTEWFEANLKKRFEQVVSFYKEHKNISSLVSRDYFVKYCPQPISDQYKAYKPCFEVDEMNSTHSFSMFYTSIGKFDKFSGKYKGYKSKSLQAESFIVMPMHSQDLCNMFNCRKSTLPQILQDWHRTKSTPWVNNLIAHVFI